MIGLIKKVGEKNYLSNSRFCTIDSAVEMSVVGGYCCPTIFLFRMAPLSLIQYHRHYV